MIISQKTMRDQSRKVGSLQKSKCNLFGHTYAENAPLDIFTVGREQRLEKCQDCHTWVPFNNYFHKLWEGPWCSCIHRIPIKSDGGRAIWCSNCEGRIKAFPL